MDVQYRESFKKDLKRIRDEKLLHKVTEIITEAKAAKNIHEIKNLKKIQEEKSYFRIRAGDYRVGMRVQGNVVTFIRFLHRKDIYRYFP